MAMIPSKIGQEYVPTMRNFKTEDGKEIAGDAQPAVAAYMGAALGGPAPTEAHAAKVKSLLGQPRSGPVRGASPRRAKNTRGGVPVE